MLKLFCFLLVLWNERTLAVPLVQTPGVSEVVKIPTMGSFKASQVPPQTNCPQNQLGLVPLTGLVDGGSLIVASGTKKLLTTSSLLGFNGVLNRITISSNSSLVFDDINMNLKVREIVVNEGGYLTMGSDSCRILSKINITFYGSSATSTHSDPSTSSAITTTPSKGLLIYGTASIHGKYYHPTWTRLATTAKNKTSTLRLQDNVNWDIGQTVLITTTVIYDCADEWATAWCEKKTHQNELRQIVAVSMNDATSTYLLTLNAPLTYEHYGGYEYQAEVALLTRNILFNGQQTNDNFGGHSKVIGQSAKAQFSSVQAENFGQLNVLGRYPFHFHMMFESDGAHASYFEDCSVTNSNFRCYTVHGTNQTRLSRNVAYNAKGRGV
jgi:hypothetical protein